MYDIEAELEEPRPIKENVLGLKVKARDLTKLGDTARTDVSWKKEQTPQNEMENKQFKLFNLRGIDYKSNIEIPKY